MATFLHICCDITAHALGPTELAASAAIGAEMDGTDVLKMACFQVFPGQTIWFRAAYISCCLKQKGLLIQEAQN